MNDFLKLARERLCRARALPVGPARNEQRQIALALRALAKLSANAVVQRPHDVGGGRDPQRQPHRITDHRADGRSKIRPPPTATEDSH